MPETLAAVAERILSRLQRAAAEAFDPDEAQDSDGYDQGERAGLLRAMQIVREELDRWPS